jgi:hypothetical protein
MALFLSAGIFDLIVAVALIAEVVRLVREQGSPADPPMWFCLRGYVKNGRVPREPAAF